MSSTDCHSAKMQFHLQDHNYHHAMSANLPTLVTRNVQSYSVSYQHPTSKGNKSTSPRYSPNIHPWKRQQAQSSLSFVPSTSSSPRVEQLEYTTVQPRSSSERPHVYMSPFRSVRKMKQPFELRLPASPSHENLAASGKESPLSQKSSKNRTLRPWRSDQNLKVTSIDSFSLLPSPPLSDTRSPQASSFYFSPKPESESDYSQEGPSDCGCVAGRESCRDCYTSPERGTRETTKNVKGTPHVQMAHSHLAKQCETSDGQLTPLSTYSERLSSPAPYSDFEPIGKRKFSTSSIAAARSRSGTVSSDGSWAPSSLSYWEPWLQRAPVEGAEGQGERLKELNRRRIQIVQKSPPPPPRKVELKAVRPAMYAVATKTKPKLVDISRQSSPAMSYTLPTPQHPIPSTPDHSQQEVSAFSPDTPLEMSDSGYITQHSCHSPNDYAHAKGHIDEEDDEKEEEELDEEDDDDAYTDVSSLTSEPVGETIVDIKSAASPELPKSPSKPELPPKFAASVQVSPGRSSTSTKSEKEELEKWWDHEWTIDQLDLSVKDFPRNMLRLTSPVIMFLRHNDERALLRPFRTIFPNVAENLLDSLCAALIARNYVVSLATTNQRKSQLNRQSRLDPVPETTTAGPATSSHATPSRIKEQVLGARSMQLQKDLDRIVEKMLFAICGQAEEHLKSAVLVLAQVLETKH
ncbi:uncharacterized protein BP01DRAFT_416264 [Aspergillus saccharolyticus JOP 1030-1]|uniref:Uncharacterized protein n=1 Tax=Aspergillus saccharolyticus JOP 1030-1 TaxID=1450539 RepID=A0A318ZC67_9EURO|nr:hypothetical protein BP01DRAFT_416264 [Aspergillus saccharolyticus JOP 1030-1]PYH44929.1 hypothetical protein BP01DRAFT_416264 [Aspergillus saccharolyticus JOP 1030-1]